MGEVAEGTEETGTALPHLVTDSVPVEVAVTIMTVGTTVAIEVTIVAAMIAMTDPNTTTVTTDMIALMTSTIAMNGPDLVHILPVSKKKKGKKRSECLLLWIGVGDVL